MTIDAKKVGAAVRVKIALDWAGDRVYKRLEADLARLKASMNNWELQEFYRRCE